MPASGQRIRVAEVVAALSLTTDLTAGVPFEKGLRTCAVAAALAQLLGLDGDSRRVVFYTALLRAVGCTAHAPENAAMFGDDIAFQAVYEVMDPGDERVFAAQLSTFGDWAGPRAGPVLARRFVEQAPTVGPYATRSACEVSRALGPRLGVPPAAVSALDDVYERWDGLGLPRRKTGDQLALPARVVHVAEQAVLAHAAGGTTAAVTEVRRRAGGHLDPDLAAAFLREADVALAPLAATDMLAVVLAAEPAPAASVPWADLERLCGALAVVADLKGRFLLGHSAHVADLATTAGRAAGLDEARVGRLRCAALAHDIGRVVVPSSVWDRPHGLGTADVERVRLHPYWTQRVLDRCPATGQLAVLAGSHHERVDGRGYHRGVPLHDLPLDVRVLAAADVYAALGEARPHRPAYSRQQAAAVLRDLAATGSQDPEACAAVLDGTSPRAPRPDWPCGLTEREVQVLRLLARGATNRHVAERLGISARTVGHHVAHIYDKVDVRTRAGLAVFAIQHRLLPEPHGGSR